MEQHFSVDNTSVKKTKLLHSQVAAQLNRHNLLIDFKNRHHKKAQNVLSSKAHIVNTRLTLCKVNKFQ